MTAKETLEPHIMQSYVRSEEDQPKPQRVLCQPQRADHRSGLYKLKQIILKLRQFYKDEDEIPREDLIDAINEFCGLDPRTERKYEKLLLRRHYLEPIGPRHQKVTRVNVRTYSQIDGSPNNNLKEYRSNQGHTTYKFGLFAPKPTVQTTIPPEIPPSSFNESQVNMENMCASQRTEEATQREEAIEKERGGGVLSHTHISTPKNFALNMSKTNMPNLALKVLKSAKHEPKGRNPAGRWLSDEERRILKVARGGS